MENQKVEKAFRKAMETLAQEGHPTTSHQGGYFFLFVGGRLRATVDEESGKTKWYRKTWSVKPRKGGE